MLLQKEVVIVLSIWKDHAVLICGQCRMPHFISNPHQKRLFKNVELIKWEENAINLKLSVLDTHSHTYTRKKRVENSNFVLFVMCNSKTKNISFSIYIWLSIYLIRKNEQTFLGVNTYHVKNKQTKSNIV